MPSEFAHIAATMAVASCRPLLLLLEKGLDQRGVLKRNLIQGVIDMPQNLERAMHALHVANNGGDYWTANE